MAETFDRLLQIRAPGRLIEQLDAAASRRMIDRSAFVRSALVEKLKSDGIGAGRWGMHTWADQKAGE